MLEQSPQPPIVRSLLSYKSRQQISKGRAKWQRTFSDTEFDFSTYHSSLSHNLAKSILRNTSQFNEDERSARTDLDCKSATTKSKTICLNASLLPAASSSSSSLSDASHSPLVIRRTTRGLQMTGEAPSIPAAHNLRIADSIIAVLVSSDISCGAMRAELSLARSNSIAPASASSSDCASSCKTVAQSRNDAESREDSHPVQRQIPPASDRARRRPDRGMDRSSQIRLLVNRPPRPARGDCDGMSVGEIVSQSADECKGGLTLIALMRV